MAIALVAFVFSGLSPGRAAADRDAGIAAAGEGGVAAHLLQMKGLEKARGLPGAVGRHDQVMRVGPEVAHAIWAAGGVVRFVLA